MVLLKKISFQITERDIELYAEVSGDFNPIHFDDQAAAQHGFPKRITHGMLTMGKIWSLLSNVLNTSYPLPTKYELTFLSPVYIGDTVNIQVFQKENDYRIIGTCGDSTVVKGSFQI